MNKEKTFDKITISIITLLIAFIVMVKLDIINIKTTYSEPLYKDKLFNEDKVSAIDIIIDDWDHFIENANLEEYVSVDLIINGMSFIMLV